MINISTVIKNKFESGDDVRAFTHKLVFKDMDTQTITNVDTNIKPITEDIKIDGIPIGKFPIANIEFSLTGDWTKTYKVGGNYEVYVVDTYKDGSVTQTLTGKSFIITEIEYDRGNRETSFKGYDYGSKLSEPFDNSSYTLPMTLGQFATKFFNSYGLQITNVNDMFMKDYKLKVIPSYDTDVMGIQVARDIAKLSLSTIFVGQDNKVKIVDITKPKTSMGSLNHFKSFEAHSDNFRSLGVNTLTLGLQADIDGENVSKSDSAMIGVDEVVELRIDDIPFVFSQDLKREVIDLMFSKIKGFKYHAFESVSKNFYYEIGDCFKQVGNGINGESYDLIAAQQTFVRNGSMITTHSIESQSKQETEMKWENFTDQRKTEILVNKATQEIKLINSSITVLGDKYTELNVKVDGIDMKVSSIGNDNIIFGFNGDNDMIGWGFLGESSLKFGDRLRFYQEMKWNSAFVPSEENSASGYKITWVNNNQAMTAKGRVIGGDKYSYRGKRVGNESRYQIYVREYLEGHTGEDDNLIKNDFSDFNGVSSAIVTRKKTFPINHFKGSKNIFQLNLIKFSEQSKNYFKGEISGKYWASPMFDNETTIMILKPNTTYTIKYDYEVKELIDNRIIPNDTRNGCLFLYSNVSGNVSVDLYEESIDEITLQSRSWKVGDIFTRKKTFTTPSGLSNAASNYRLLAYTARVVDSNGVQVGIEQGTFRHIKLIEGGNQSELFSPAPEDGYGLNLTNGAWHIETTAGSNAIKYMATIGVSTKDEVYYSRVKVKSFNESLSIYNNIPTTPRYDVPISELITYERQVIGNGASQLQFQFRSQVITEKLDFIASDPSIYIGFTESLLLDTVSPKAIETASITLKPDTRSVRLRIVGKTGLSLTDQMFNRGEPREWELSAEDVKIWAESQILIRDNTIALQAQEIDNLNNDIHNAGIEINAVNGITTWGSSLNVMNSDKSKSLLSVVTKDGEEYLQMDLSNGTLGNFTMENGAQVLTTPLQERDYFQSDLSVIRTIITTNRTPTQYEIYLYDFNNSGTITTLDYTTLKNYLIGDTVKPKKPMIQNRVVIGNNNGEILTQELFNNGNIGSESRLIGNRLDIETISLNGMTFGGKVVEIEQSTGYFKVQI